jgi:RNA polymerase sigma-70 factor (ECF subfamily)
MPLEIDHSLIRRAQNKDPTAIGVIYERLQGYIFRYLYYKVGDFHAAEDLTAEVFIRVIKALPRYRQNAVPLRAWVMKIARNLAIDHFRRTGHREPLPLKEELLAGDEHPEKFVERQLTSDALARALEKLTEDQREVIALRFLAEMTILEVSEVLGKNQSAVKALQRRGLRSLNRILVDWKVRYDGS